MKLLAFEIYSLQLQQAHLITHKGSSGTEEYQEAYNRRLLTALAQP